MRKNVFFTTVGCLLLTFVLAGFVACSKKEASPAAAGADKGAALSATRTIVDHTGAEVVLPAQINRIVISGLAPLPSMYCLYTGSSKGLVGMPASSMAAAKHSFLLDGYPEIVAVDTDFESSGVINIERLLELEPDVVFYGSSTTQTRQALENAGIPAVGFSTNLHGYNTVETYASWIELFGQIFSGSDLVESTRATEIIEYGRGVEALIKERVAGIPQEERPRVMVAYYYDDAGGLRTSGSTHFGQYWIEVAGGVNVASELDGTPTVNMEQVYQWNPDAIFITNFSPRLPEDFYNNTIAADDWSTVKAVQTGRVHKFPLGMYRWYPPSSDTPLSLMWMAKTLHPDLFADIDLDQMVKDYFQKFYGVDLTAEDLHKIYNPSREASGR